MDWQTDIPDTVGRRVIAEGGKHIGLVDLDAQTKTRLFRELTEAREAGEGVPDMVKRIRDKIPAGPWSDTKTRAETIARTETLHAQRFSSLEMYKANEDVSAVMVFDNLIGFDDEDCSDRDGEIVDLDDAEGMMDDEHPNGTLNFAPVVE